MTFEHKPVLLEECMDALCPEQGGIYVDGTLGGGGHSQAILQRLPAGSRLIGIDRDEDAIKAASQRLARFGEAFQAVRGNFFDIKQLLGALHISQVKGILVDLGVSSWQLDSPERGFSYQHDAPLDMRMDHRAAFSALDVVNTYDHGRLARILTVYGEERWASRIASFIVNARQEAPIQTTGQLVDLIKAAIPTSARRTGSHPAKRTFQAIRIEVNAELEGLAEALESMVDMLSPGGRLAVISFHSLEDRIVKRTFARLQSPCTCPPKTPICICGNLPSVKLLSKKPIEAAAAELQENPRARSAKLRTVEKIGQ